MRARAVVEALQRDRAQHDGGNQRADRDRSPRPFAELAHFAHPVRAIHYPSHHSRSANAKAVADATSSGAGINDGKYEPRIFCDGALLQPATEGRVAAVVAHRLHA
jgi:hypothetical protein